VATPEERTFFFPFVVNRGVRTSVDLAPARVAVPTGFRLVPAGLTLVGELDETMRRGFCETVPLHEVNVKTFLIAENETTNQEWIVYLEALKGPEREARRPLVATVQGMIDLRPMGHGAWTFAMRPTRRVYQARGATVRYEGRDRLIEQEWRRFPVAGISADDAEAYVGWLASTGRVPGARLCTELEWERAARGADGRPYPTGEHLGATQANFDQTYGRVSEAFGPDQVGVHVASNSPFGVADLAGNVWEIVRPSFGREPALIRGGGYFHDDQSARSSNRHVIDASARAAYVGVRVCADVPLHSQQ
jgi:formylglycine-generating enzyme required for sulfatase activity